LRTSSALGFGELLLGIAVAEGMPHHQAHSSLGESGGKLALEGDIQ
jgi:hypothetical protein